MAPRSSLLFLRPTSGTSDTSAHLNLRGVLVAMSLAPPSSAPARPRTRRRKIGIVDLVTKNTRRSLYGRLMNANLASIMPQALAVWSEEAGHDVHYVCYTGAE